MKKLVLIIMFFVGLNSFAQDLFVMDSTFIPDKKLQLAKERINSFLSVWDIYYDNELAINGVVAFDSAATVFKEKIELAYEDYYNAHISYDSLPVEVKDGKYYALGGTLKLSFAEKLDSLELEMNTLNLKYINPEKQADFIKLDEQVKELRQIIKCLEQLK